MECVFGVMGRDFAVVVADTSAVQSILVHKNNEGKIMLLDSHMVLGASGEPGDLVQFTEYVQKNVHLYKFKNSMPLSTAAAANFTPDELSTALRKFARSFPIQRVNESRLKHLDTLKVLRSSSNHDGRFHIKQIISFAATDKQEPITSPTSDTAVLEESESSSGDSPASGSSSYFTERGVGKPGFISFQGSCSQTRSVESVPHPGKEGSRLVWFVGPTILVAKVLSAVFEDPLLTGVAIFVLLIDKVWRPLQQVAPKSYIWSKSRFFRIYSVTTMVLSLIILLLTMDMVWSWTGPAASATLAPYLVGLVVQLEFEQYARHHKSPSWPVIPIILEEHLKNLRAASE